MYRTRRYRYANERVVLFITLFIALSVIVLTSTVTFCLSGVFILAMIVLSAGLIRSHHQYLIRNGIPVNTSQMPDLTSLVGICQQKLQPGDIDVYLTQKNQMNAYAFGLGKPKVLVLYTPLLKFMNTSELTFIIGHEMGHVALGHTWLNTLVGGMAGIPAPFGAAIILYAVFRWWNRMCEYSADRAGLLACGDLDQAVTALVRLVAPDIRSQQDFNRVMMLLNTKDDRASNRVAEVFQSHPMLIRRINKLRDYASTREYQTLQVKVNQNVRGALPQLVDKFDYDQSVATGDPPGKEPELPPEERWPWLKPLEPPTVQSQKK